MLTTLSSGGINWTWYLECELHDDDTVTILRHYRLHNDRDAGHPASSSGRYAIGEDDARNAVEVIVSTVVKGRGFHHGP